ncbi:methylmalonyl Co-A mutase-associated GTPase MeaB [Robiginitalea sp. M366]|uniref:methylmalonyl Co-A mutase-associated GTPase MeaB n=1 Tax=Robiginitalea aestuariiviva TaxID=3036903 RepID=UPI00240DCF2B|nr:methylmalonyl Co-A mutase-associated GTPase MeaB [Robiginitalea aestuariiviva]MDG1572384.1 methylmalonyl Co-A mutase-associated GTPase MeaB [Robiginitalea aestuariiviva]
MAPQKMRKPRDLDHLIRTMKTGDRGALARAITLVESALATDAVDVRKLVEACLDSGKNSIRIGITGVPGAGKSTFIEALGLMLANQGIRVAVLAVDPSSRISRGSILGDKTRMQELSRHENAYIRPSPAGTSLGGVTRRTRETISLCEAAGYQVILIETVGVGQSETAVHGMSDFFLLLKIAGAGDELQGIKRGIVEMADAIAINKAEGENREAANRAATQFRQALHLYPPKAGGWSPKVMLCSALEGSGIEDLWTLIREYTEIMKASGWFGRKRTEQNLEWMRRTLEDRLVGRFYEDPAFQAAYAEKREAVARLEMSPFGAAEALLEAFTRKG